MWLIVITTSIMHRACTPSCIFHPTRLLGGNPGRSLAIQEGAKLAAARLSAFGVSARWPSPSDCL